MAEKVGRVRLGIHRPKAEANGQVHAFISAPQRPRRCAYCGRAMADHPLFEYRPVKEKT